MRRPTLGATQATHVSHNDAAARPGEEAVGTMVPVGSAVETPVMEGDFYHPPDGAAEMPETIPRDDTLD